MTSKKQCKLTSLPTSGDHRIPGQIRVEPLGTEFKSLIVILGFWFKAILIDILTSWPTISKISHVPSSLSKSNVFYLQPKFDYTDEHDVSCDVVLIQPIGDLKTIDIKSDNHKLWSIFHIDKILVWNDLLDRYHQFTGKDNSSQF